MAVVETSLYFVTIAVILLTICTLKISEIATCISKAALRYPFWSGGRLRKHYLQDVPDVTVDEKPSPNYSPQWWTDAKQFQLERRAVFSKTWLFVTHVSRFQRPGDYRNFEIAGFSFIVILGKDKQFRVFHNVCRHRAYAITKKESGSSTVLRCRYHGWSYDTKGQLIKAPEFDSVAGFDKALNSLWELQTEIREGTIFVHLEVGSTIPRLQLGESESILRGWNIGNMTWAQEWRLEGNFNWKLAEFLVVKVSGMDSSWTWALPGAFRVKSHRVVVSYNTILQRLPSGHVLTLRALPLSSNRTSIECNLYGTARTHTKTTQLELQATKTAVTLAVKSLELEQKLVLDGCSYKQSLNQEKLSEILATHRVAEEGAGMEIHPAARKQSFSQEGMVDDELCQELESSLGHLACAANTRGLLDW